MNCSSTPSPQRSLSPLFLLAAVSLALAPVGFAQTAAPAAPAVAAPAAAAAPAVIVGTVAATPVPSLSGTDKVGPMVLRDETIGQVLELLQRWTGKTVLRPQALPASLYTLSLPATATRNDALLAIETLLTLNGVAVIQQGDKFLKVVPNNVAKAESPTLLSESTLSLPASGRVASKIFLLKHANGQEVVVQIQGMLNSTLGTAPVFFGRNNAILVTDSIMNLQKIETLLAQLDRPQLDVIATKLYNLKHAMATDMVNKLTALLRTPAAAIIIAGQLNTVPLKYFGDWTQRVANGESLDKVLPEAFAVASSADGAKLIAAVNGGGIWTSQSTPAPRLRLACSAHRAGRGDIDARQASPLRHPGPAARRELRCTERCAGPFRWWL